MKKIFNKLNGKGVLGAVVSIASIISAIDGLVSERNRAKEFEELKKAVSELQKK